MNIEQLEKHKHSWGCEYWLHNDRRYCMKVLVFRSRTKGSRHYHTNKEETMLVVKGKFRISGVQGYAATYIPGDFVTFDPGTPHQIKCIKSGWIVEASTFHDDNDVTRIKSVFPQDMHPKLGWRCNAQDALDAPKLQSQREQRTKKE